MLICIHAHRYQICLSEINSVEIRSGRGGQKDPHYGVHVAQYGLWVQGINNNNKINGWFYCSFHNFYLVLNTVMCILTKFLCSGWVMHIVKDTSGNTATVLKVTVWATQSCQPYTWECHRSTMHSSYCNIMSWNYRQLCNSYCTVSIVYSAWQL